MRPRMKTVFNPRYSPARPPRKPAAALIEAPQWAYGADASLPCSECGWALGAVNGSLFFVGTTETGERKFKHHTCPTLSERRELRRAALVNA